MSSQTYERIVRIKAIDDTTPVLMGIRRIFSSTRMEMRSLGMEFDWLAEQEIISAEAAELLGSALDAMIPIVGMIGAALGIITAVQLTAQRAIIPVGQTAPGEVRSIGQTGPIIAHAGEIIGRPQQVGFGGGGGVTVNFYDAQMSTKRDVQETLGDIGTMIYDEYRRYRT